MKATLRKSGAIAAAAILASSCAVRPPIATTTDQPATLANQHPGSVTIPLTLPALTEPSVQFAYDRNYINTVEVRLRDSLGNQFVRYIARNVYLTDSRKAGTVDVTFHNVMPGTFTLTVRTSHLRLIAATDGPIKYDPKPGTFFGDDIDWDHGFDPGETEFNVVSGGIADKFVVFADDNIDADWVFPSNLRTDITATKAGFGVGAATASIVPGATTRVAVQVGQLPALAPTMPMIVQEITAGETLSLSLASSESVHVGTDSVMVTSPSVNFTNGIVNIGDPRLNVYDLTLDPATAKVSFTATRTTNATTADAPSAWPIWLMRGQAAAEWGMTPNGAGTNAPRVIVQPALVNQTQSRIFAKDTHVVRNGTSQIQYDLRDSYGNPVAGNIPGVNTISLGSLRKANAFVTMDYALVSYSYGDDPRYLPGQSLSPFILPGRTTGTVSPSGLYTQGSTPPAQLTEAATYSVKKTDGNTDHDLRIKRLEIPYHIYEKNVGAFGNGDHLYVLNVVDRPAEVNRAWVYLERVGGPIIASTSVDVTQNQTDLNLPLNVTPAGTLPVPIQPTRVPPVIIKVPNRPVTAADDHGTRFNITSYGVRRISDQDTVQVRVLNAQNQAFVQPISFQWAK